MPDKSTERKQGTFEWFKDRYGKITGSGDRIGTLLGNNPHSKNKLLETIRDEHTHTDDQILEAFHRDQDNQNEWMRWGSQHEEEAVRTYQLQNNVDVIYSPGFLRHPDYPEICGVSRDGVDTTNNWLIECKCPGKIETQPKTIRYGMGSWYHNQTQLGLECDRERDFLIFVSYDPRQPVLKDRLYQQLIRRDDKWIERFRRAMGEFYDHWKNGTDFRHPTTTTGGEGVPQLF